MTEEEVSRCLILDNLSDDMKKKLINAVNKGVVDFGKSQCSTSVPKVEYKDDVEVDGGEEQEEVDGGEELPTLEINTAEVGWRYKVYNRSNQGTLAQIHQG